MTELHDEASESDDDDAADAGGADLPGDEVDLEAELDGILATPVRIHLCPTTAWLFALKVCGEGLRASSESMSRFQRTPVEVMVEVSEAAAAVAAHRTALAAAGGGCCARLCQDLLGCTLALGGIAATVATTGAVAGACIRSPMHGTRCRHFIDRLIVVAGADGPYLLAFLLW